MTEEIQLIRSTINDLRDSADEMERALNAIGKDGGSLMDKVSWLKRENEVMRKVLGLCSEYISDGRCEGCVVKPSCNAGGIDCWMRVKLMRMMYDLGIEVD